MQSTVGGDHCDTQKPKHRALQHNKSVVHTFLFLLILFNICLTQEVPLRNKFSFYEGDLRCDCWYHTTTGAISIKMYDSYTTAAACAATVMIWTEMRPGNCILENKISSLNILYTSPCLIMLQPIIIPTCILY